MSQYQKGKTNLDFIGARDSEWQWHQLGHMQICTSLQTDNHASTPPLSFLQAGCPSCHPTNSVKALKARLGVSTEEEKKEGGKDLLLQDIHTHPFNGPLSGTTQVSRYQKGKTNLDFTEQETVSGSSNSWAICKSAPRSRQITTPAPHHSIFYRPDALPAAQPTASKH